MTALTCHRPFQRLAAVKAARGVSRPSDMFAWHALTSASAGYSFEDTIVLSRARLGEAYDSKMAIFYTEHIHSDEEVRYVTEGQGYFDVRVEREVAGLGLGSWVRIAMRAGDLIVLPAGMYHRFTLDESENITANRLFVGEPVWTPINRGEEGTEEHPARAAYLSRV
jgi:cupin superfamily acireductone dioxygenase involved in methionine salvage